MVNGRPPDIGAAVKPASPSTVSASTVTDASPVLVNASTCSADSPTSKDPKSSAEGAACNHPTTPVPDQTTSSRSPVVSPTRTVPASDSSPAGMYVSVSVPASPGSSVGRSSTAVSDPSPSTVMIGSTKVSGAAPEFTTPTCAMPSVPAGTAPKSTTCGVTDSRGSSSVTLKSEQPESTSGKTSGGESLSMGLSIVPRAVSGAPNTG